ncbi:DNA damage response, partial [Fusarium albosuccineum]
MEHVERQMNQQASQDLGLSSLATPLNFILFSAVLYTAYALLRPSPPPQLPRDAPSTVFRTYTPH